MNLSLENRSRLRVLVMRILGAGLLVAIANLPFWLLELQYAVVRPVFNADSFLAFLLLGFGAWYWAPTLAFVWLMDILHGLAIGFHFETVGNFLSTAKFLPHLAFDGFFGAQLLWAGIIFAVSLVLAVLVQRWTRPKIWDLGFMLAILTILDVANGSGLPALIKTGAQSSFNLQGSYALNWLASSLQDQSQSEKMESSFAEAENLAMEVNRWAETNPSSSILLVIVESWGNYREPAVRQWTEASFQHAQVAKRWQLIRRDMPFKGATTAGELRILCNSGRSYKRLTVEYVHRCLASQLRLKGFETVAMHGFSRYMFDRDSWWSKIGFDRMLFEDDFRNAPRCGTLLRGVCDAYMIDYAVSNIGHRRFSYLLTLETHLPLTSASLNTEEENFCAKTSLSKNVCQHAIQIRRTLSQLMSALEKTKSAPLVIIIGDHAPPFLVATDRTMFSSTHVPWVMAVPR